MSNTTPLRSIMGIHYGKSLINNVYHPTTIRSYKFSNGELYFESSPDLSGNWFQYFKIGDNYHIISFDQSQSYSVCPQIIEISVENFQLFDPLYNSVSILLPMSGLNGDTEFTDYSPNNISEIVNGTVTISDSESVSDGVSAFFDSGYLEYSDSSLSLTTQSTWTIEGWFLTNNVSGDTVQGIFFNGDTTSNSDRLQCEIVNDGSFGIYIQGSQNVNIKSIAGLISSNTWYNFIIKRDGDDYYVYLDGVLVANDTTSAMTSVVRNDLYIGMSRNGGQLRSIQGYIDDFRITFQDRYPTL